MSYCSSGCFCPDYYKLIGFEKVNYIIFKETIGIMASILTAITLLPQIYLAIHSHGKETMSPSFLVITMFATIFWFMYGILLGSLQTVVLEVIVFINVGILTICKIKYKVSVNLLENNLDNSDLGESGDNINEQLDI